LQRRIGNSEIYAPMQGFGLQSTFSARTNVQEGQTGADTFQLDRWGLR
jgi:hypothetical protein